MKRNNTKAIEQGQKIIEQNPKYDLCLSEIDTMTSLAEEEANHIDSIPFYCIKNAFLAGIAIGARIKSKG